MADADEPVPDFLDQSVTFPDGKTFDLIKPLTNFRSCHDGKPFEARMVFICRDASDTPTGIELIMKIKVQLPATDQKAEAGPSTTTAHELKALEIFRAAETPFAPRLVAFCQKTQDGRGPLPGGFLTFTVMTKLPGQALFGKFWKLPPDRRAEIIPKAVEALRAIYSIGIEPVDRGLRNVMWEPETKQCGIIDFEIWSETSTTFADEKTEMQRWGLMSTPPAKDHWVAWNQMYR